MNKIDLNHQLVKQPYYLANQPEKAIWLTNKEAFFVSRRMFKQSGLDLDTYMSLIDPNYPVCA